MSEIWRQDKDKEINKGKKINKGKDQRKKTKKKKSYNYIKLSHKFKKIMVIHLRAFSVMKVVKTNFQNKMEIDFLTDSLML